MSDQPTIKAVLQEADRLRLRADYVQRPDSPGHDPYARPYYPTTAAAHKMLQRTRTQFVRQALAALPGNATAEQRQAAEDQAKDRAPAAVIQEMRSRATAREQARRLEKERDSDSRKRMVGFQREAGRARDEELRGLTPGQRIDRALATLAVVAAPSASGDFEPRVSGESHRDAPPFAPDPAGKARSIAIDAVRQVEAEVRHAQRRVVEEEAA